MKNNLLSFDLQLFADEAGENEVPVAAEQEAVEVAESDGSETAETEGSGEPEKQSDEDNARFASVRRKAEEDFRKKFDAEIAKRDAEFAELCKGINHPVTGKPITTEAEYMDALRQQRRLQNEAELRDKGVNPEIIDKMIEENPVVMQAKEVLEKSKREQAEQALQKDLEEIMSYDDSIKGMSDLANLPNFGEIVERVQRGFSLVEAYKAVNFDTFMQKQKAAAHQQSINEMRGKSHMGTTQSVASQDDSVDVPSDVLARWRAEGKSDKEIHDLYNKVLKKLHLTN